MQRALDSSMNKLGKQFQSLETDRAGGRQIAAPRGFLSSNTSNSFSMHLPGLRTQSYCRTYSFSASHRLNYIDAVDLCARAGGRLAVPTSDLQFDRIRAECNYDLFQGCYVKIWSCLWVILIFWVFFFSMFKVKINKHKRSAAHHHFSIKRFSWTTAQHCRSAINGSCIAKEEFIEQKRFQRFLTFFLVRMSKKKK